MAIPFSKLKYKLFRFCCGSVFGNIIWFGQKKGMIDDHSFFKTEI